MLMLFAGWCVRSLALLFVIASLLTAQPRRKVIVNEDASGPGGSDLQTILLMLQSPEVDVLGITIVSGDQWRDEEVAHTLRLLELIGRTDVPVMAGAEYPLLRRREPTLLWEKLYGKVSYKGAWDERWWHEASVVPPLKEGQPGIKASSENAVDFLVRMVHKYPNEVTIYEGGPMTDVALAIGMDPDFPKVAKELVFMGGSLNPDPQYEEFAENPRHEFNFWFDPEAAEIVLSAPWKRIVCTPTDISVKTRLLPEMVKRIGESKSPVAQYVAKYYVPGLGNDFMWDELAAAAWIDPTIITQKMSKYMGVDLNKAAGYGNTLTSDTRVANEPDASAVQIHVDLNKQKFLDMFVTRMQSPTQQPPH